MSHRARKHSPQRSSVSAHPSDCLHLVNSALRCSTYHLVSIEVHSCIDWLVVLSLKVPWLAQINLPLKRHQTREIISGFTETL